MAPRPRTPLTEAILDQLRAEISAHGTTVKDTATVMEIDYWTFRKYVKGERDMPLDVLTRALDALGLDYPTFVRRASGRLSAPQGD